MITTNIFFVVCRFQRHVHTYRILPDADGVLAVQVRAHAVSYKGENHPDTFKMLNGTSILILLCLINRK